MTAPKGSPAERVQRLRLKAIEAITQRLDPATDAWEPSAEQLDAFSRLCDQAEGAGYEDRMTQLSERVRALEDTLAGVRSQEPQGFKMG